MTVPGPAVSSQRHGNATEICSARGSAKTKPRVKSVSWGFEMKIPKTTLGLINDGRENLKIG